MLFSAIAAFQRSNSENGSIDTISAAVTLPLSRGSCLIINLPGKPKAIRQCLDAVFPAVPYCIDLMDGPYLQCNASVINAFRPKS